MCFLQTAVQLERVYSLLCHGTVVRAGFLVHVTTKCLQFGNNIQCKLCSAVHLKHWKDPDSILEKTKSRWWGIPFNESLSVIINKRLLILSQYLWCLGVPPSLPKPSLGANSNPGAVLLMHTFSKVDIHFMPNSVLHWDSAKTSGPRWVGAAVVIRHISSIQRSQLQSHDPQPRWHRSAGDCPLMVFLLPPWSRAEGGAWWEDFSTLLTGMWCATGSDCFTCYSTSRCALTCR